MAKSNLKKFRKNLQNDEEQNEGKRRRKKRRQERSIKEQYQEGIDQDLKIPNTVLNQIKYWK